MLEPALVVSLAVMCAGSMAEGLDLCFLRDILGGEVEAERWCLRVKLKCREYWNQVESASSVEFNRSIP